jgi:hypothetical protein
MGIHGYFLGDKTAEAYPLPRPKCMQVNVEVKPFSFQICMLEIPVSNLGSQPGYTDSGFS